MTGSAERYFSVLARCRRRALASRASEYSSRHCRTRIKNGILKAMCKKIFDSHHVNIGRTIVHPGLTMVGEYSQSTMTN